MLSSQKTFARLLRKAVDSGFLGTVEANDVVGTKMFRVFSSFRRSKRIQRLTRQSADPTGRWHGSKELQEVGKTQPNSQPLSLQKDASHELINLARQSSLIITRDVEWGQVLLGFEQAQRYNVCDAAGNVVALLLEEHGGLGRALSRQLLRSRRGFTATLLTPDGNDVLFRLQRPPFLVTSAIFIEDGEGHAIGEVHQKWHLYRRRYELFLGKKQFASIDGDFLAWEFLMRDEHGNPLALIDRNFSGFGRELFTDAGRYCIHFGESPKSAALHVENCLAYRNPKHATKVPSIQLNDTKSLVIPTTIGDQLIVHKPLILDERLIALATAISIDYDYFSRHSHGHGMLSPIMPLPLPMPPIVDSGPEGSRAPESPSTEDKHPSSEDRSELDPDEDINENEEWTDHQRDDTVDIWTDDQDPWQGGEDSEGGSILDLFWDDD